MVGLHYCDVLGQCGNCKKTRKIVNEVILSRAVTVYYSVTHKARDMTDDFTEFIMSFFP